MKFSKSSRKDIAATEDLTKTKIERDYQKSLAIDCAEQCIKGGIEITEQDAMAILLEWDAYRAERSASGVTPAHFKKWLNLAGRDLLNKLNADREQVPAVDAETHTSYCALNTINDDQVRKVVRAFWRRIYPYRNNYGIELPTPMPVEFMAHMATALTWIDNKGEPAVAVPDNVGLIPMHNGKPDITDCMKVECIGEFSWQEEAPYYDEDGELHDYVATHAVPWDLCKEIYKRMASAALLASAPSHSQQSAVYGYVISDGFTEQFVKTLSDDDRKTAKRFNWDVIAICRCPSHESEQGGGA